MKRTLYPLATLCAIFCAFLPAAWSAPQKGMTLYAGWWVTNYSGADAAGQIPKIQALGADSIAVIPQWFQATKSSTVIYQDAQKSPSDDGIRSIIGKAKAAGLKVFLKPHCAVLDGTWGGAIAPSNLAAWQASYRSFILRFAQMAAETRCDLFAVGVEYQSIDQYDAAWRALVRDVRTVYSGPVVYCANWGYPPNGDVFRVSWWDAVDYIGVDAYWPQIDASVVSNLDALAAKWGKPVILTEIGYSKPAADKAALFEGAWKLLAAWPRFAGWYPWAFYISDGGVDPNGVYLNAQPAVADSFKRIYAAQPPTDDLALLRQQLAAMTGERDILAALVARLKAGLVGIRDTAAGLVQ